MNKKIVLGVVIVLLVFAVIACTQSEPPLAISNNSDSIQTGQIKNAAQPADRTGDSNSQVFNPATTRSIDILDDSFSPPVVQIKLGDTITWTNTVQTEHSVKADSFSSGNLRKGETFSYQFPSVGTYGYTCGNHPDMTGRIIVE